MSGPSLTIISSENGSSWDTAKVIPKGQTYYGLQMANYRGELYGIMTSTDKTLHATKFKVATGWKEYRDLPSKFLSQGRASVTVLEDRFFIARRGTNDAVYLLWTDDFETFHDVGRVGSQYAKTMAAPAIAAHDGKLHIVGVGADKYIYHTVADSDGQRLQRWQKIEGTGTQSALALVVFNAKLYLLHCGFNNDKFFYQHLEEDGSWSKLQSVTNNITSGLSATCSKYNSLVVTYRGRDKDVKWQAFDGQNWSSKQYIPDTYMYSQTGASTWAGRLVVSYAMRDEQSRFSGYRHRLMSMSEKSGFLGSVKELDGEEWDCKWTEQSRPKSWIQKMFCL